MLYDDSDTHTKPHDMPLILNRNDVHNNLFNNA